MKSTESAPLALRARQAAKMLSISERTLWTWTQSGAIPHRKVGDGSRQIVLYPVDGLQAWLRGEANTTKAADGGAS